MIKLKESAPVVIRFQIGDYSDALHFVDQADRDNHTDEQIEAMCQARYDNWLAVINAPRPEVPHVPSDDEYAQSIVALCERHGIDIAALNGGNEPVVSMPYTNTIAQDYEALMAYLVAAGLEVAE